MPVVRNPSVMVIIFRHFISGGLVGLLLLAVQLSVHPSGRIQLTPYARRSLLRLNDSSIFFPAVLESIEYHYGQIGYVNFG